MVTEFVSSDGVAISLADGEAGDIRGLVRLCLRSAGLRRGATWRQSFLNPAAGACCSRAPVPRGSSAVHTGGGSNTDGLTVFNKMFFYFPVSCAIIFQQTDRRMCAERK